MRRRTAFYLMLWSTTLSSGVSVADWIWAPGNRSPAFERCFKVGADVVRSELRICGLGFYEAYLNGTKVGDAVLEPAPGIYDRHVLFRTYPLPVTNGLNRLSVLLGHSWYDVRAKSAWANDRDRWRGEPRLKAEMRLVRADGSAETVPTDASWRQIPNPVAFDDIREGEVIDPSFVLPRKGLKAQAEIAPSPGGAEVDADFPIARVVRRYRPKAVWSLGADGWMVDAGVDLAGWVRLKVHGLARGDVVSIRYDERIRPDGHPTERVPRVKGRLWPDHARVIDCYVKSTPSDDVLPGGAFQMDRFVATGNAEDTYEPRFTYNGFRYVWVRGVKGELTAADVEVCEVQTDFSSVASFRCSDSVFNRLMAMAERAYRSNFTTGIPTDCPQREKNGWCGDALLASEYAQYQFDNTAAYRNVMRVWADAQREDGALPGIVPTSHWGYSGAWKGRGYGPHACGIVAYLPWMLYVYQDDATTFGTVYETVFRYLDYVRTDVGEDGLVLQGLRDWMAPRSDTPAAFLATSAYCGMLRIARRMAEVRGDAVRVAAMSEEYARTRTAFNCAFYRGNGIYDRGQQTAQAIAITYGLAETSEIPQVSERLVERVKKDGIRINYGVFGSKHVLRALSESGRTDLAYAMLVSRQEPSPVASWLEKGATSLWEDWTEGFSRNHVMFGDFACWAYQYLAGIRLPEGSESVPAVPDPQVRGFREVVIDPQIIDALDFVEATVRGYRVSWRRNGDDVTLRVVVPQGCVANVKLLQSDGEGSRFCRLQSGERVFTFPSKKTTERKKP